jgi:hypothetical protein
MKSKIAILVLVLMLCSLFFACAPKKEAVKDDWKIGIMTGTVSQNEEEYRQAVNMQKLFGADKIIVTTYPERFMQE